jgi:hypothetical protein
VRHILTTTKQQWKYLWGVFEWEFVQSTLKCYIPWKYLRRYVYVHTAVMWRHTDDKLVRLTRPLSRRCITFNGALHFRFHAELLERIPFQSSYLTQGKQRCKARLRRI